MLDAPHSRKAETEKPSVPHSLAWLLALACLPLSFLDFFFSRVQISSAMAILRCPVSGQSVATRSRSSLDSQQSLGHSVRPASADSRIQRLSPLRLLSRCRLPCPGCPAASKYPIVQCESVSFCLSGKFCVRVLGFCNFAFLCSFTSLLCWLPDSWTFVFS